MNRESAWQEAYQWLCQQRKNAPAGSDVWHLRFHWERDGEGFRQRVEQGEYRLKPMRVVKRLSDDSIAMWDADDAMVLKWVALQIQDVMPVHPKCHHVKGAGVHYSRREVKNALDSGEYKFVYRTDIRGYYQHMQKNQLNALVQKWVKDPILLALVEQYIAYSVEDGGEFHTPVNGISRGCALSPLLGASLLFHVDEMFAGKTDLFYARYMDDFLVLSKKRWPLRRAIRLLNEQMNAGGFMLHPDKTQIGRVEKGFDWLGLWFDEEGVRRSPRSLQMRANKILRLYERKPVSANESFSSANKWIKKGWLAAGGLMLSFANTTPAVVIDFGSSTIDVRTNSAGTFGTSPTASFSVVPATTGSLDFVSNLHGGGSTACMSAHPMTLSNIDIVAGYSGAFLIGWADSTSVRRIKPSASFPLTSPLTTRFLMRSGGVSSSCQPVRGQVGPFTEDIGALVQLDGSGTEIFREPVTATGVMYLSTCGITSATVPLGDISRGPVGSVLKQDSVDLKLTCNSSFPGFDAVSFSASSSFTDGEYFLSDPDNGFGVRLKYDGGTIVPGGVNELSSQSLVLSTELVQRSTAVTAGPFSILTEITLMYE